MENQLSTVEIVDYLQKVIPPVKQIEYISTKKKNLESQLSKKQVHYDTKFSIIKTIIYPIGIEVGIFIFFMISILLVEIATFIFLLVPFLIMDILGKDIFELLDNTIFDTIFYVITFTTSICFYVMILRKYIYDKEICGGKIISFVGYIIFMLYHFLPIKGTVFLIICLISYIIIPIILCICLNKYKVNCNINLNSTLTKERDQLSKEIASLTDQSHQIYSQNAELIESVPEAYCNSYSLQSIANIIQNRRADTLKEALNVYEQDEHNKRMENMMTENNEKVRQLSQQVSKEMSEIKSDVETARKAAERAANRPAGVIKENHYYYW
ncbi:MAG: hypothetical protein LUI06_06560 [Ruminococcus sp.]|nr:hypothetical protein [Ruminococcus sp.]